MKKRIITALAGLFLAVGVSVMANATPAEAHPDGAPAALGCGATRPNSSYNTEHAHVVAMGTYPAFGVGWIRSWCQAYSPVLGYRCFWVEESWTSGHHFLYSSEHHCAYVG